MRAPCLALLFLLATLPLTADEQFPLGHVIAPLVSLQDPAQSYVLYLPARYTTARRWPVLYCFDPGGRGAVPAALFREAAEKYGWILAASNNSRNGPWKDIYEAACAVWDDTHARLRIDDSRVYATGFSGGARVACALARILNMRPAGVIGCGAGLPEWLAPADLSGIPWFGTAGFGDFNLQEMKELEKELLRLGSPCALKVFPGRHVWPPAGIAMEAVAWLEELFLGPQVEESDSVSDSDSKKLDRNFNSTMTKTD